MAFRGSVYLGRYWETRGFHKVLSILDCAWYDGEKWNRKRSKGIKKSDFFVYFGFSFLLSEKVSLLGFLIFDP